MAKGAYLGIGDETTTYSKTLSSSDFQQGYYLFASGQTGGESSPNYYRSTNFHSVSYPNAVTVTTEYTLNTDSGFIWYDSNYSYLGSAGSDATPIVSGSSFTAIPPSNAAYCKFNINKTNIVSTGVGSVLVKVHSVARNVKNIYVGVNGVAKNVIKCYIGDANGKAQLCFEDVNTELTQEWSTAGTYSVTVPDWATKAVITACGGGGGGAFGSSSSGYFPGGGGGGGGAAVYETAYAVSSLKGQSISITVGAGGTAGSRSSRTGGAGGNTIIGRILTLNGGGGGIIHSGSSPSPGGSAGGAGGGAGGESGGSQSGSSSGTSGGSGVLGRGGSGGSNIDWGEGVEAGGGGGGGSLGNGGKGATGASTNNTAGEKGGGGGGGASYQAGAAGGSGYVQITWYKR